jgi:hypothetical protein
MVDNASVVVRVEPVEGDDLDNTMELTRRLLAELLDLDVEAVEPLTGGTAPHGAKGSSLVGMLVVKLGPAGLKAVYAKLRDWASRNGRSVEVTIDGDTVKVTGATAQQQEQLINTWLARHAPNP